MRSLGFLTLLVLLLAGCDLIQMKDRPGAAEGRTPVARVNNSYLYKDELAGIAASGGTKQDSAARVEAFIESWIRKELLIQEASRKININEAEVERKIMDYRYSLIAYAYQTHYIQQHLDTAFTEQEVREYYEKNIDNFILKQNIVRGTFIKVPKSAPKVDQLKDLIFSNDEADRQALKSYCLSFSVAYHISDSTWMIFDDLVRQSPLMEIPNKVQFLKQTPYYETRDDHHLYFLKVDEYRISDNVSPLEFVQDEIRNIMLNKRKVELAKRLEDEVYEQALDKKRFEIFTQ
jgi:hypothetical protein